MGVNAWVIHSDENIWGKDVHEFRPERWLVEKEQLAFLDQNYLAVSSFYLSDGIKLLYRIEFVLIQSTVWRRFKNMHRQKYLTPRDE